MKNILKIFTLSVLILACSREKPNLKLFSPESFAYSTEQGWELDTSVRVKGFQKEKQGEKITAKLSFSVDIVTPNGDTLKNAYDGLKDVSEEENISETPIDVQIEFDSTFAKGNYIVVFNVEDNLSSQEATISDTVKVGD